MADVYITLMEVPVNLKLGAMPVGYITLEGSSKTNYKNMYLNV